jgi:hypothetical protein
MMAAIRPLIANSCNHDAYLLDRNVEIADQAAYYTDIAVLEAFFEERARFANGGDAVRNGEQRGSSYPDVELVARHLHLHGLQHPIPETHQARVTSVADGQFLELAIRWCHLVGLAVSLCRNAGAWLDKVWRCPWCAGLATCLHKLSV